MKKTRIGDTIAFQWFFCFSVWLCGLIVAICYAKPSNDDDENYLVFPKIYPRTFLGGFLWCTGNCLTYPAVKFIGMALGLLVWNATNMTFGWASGTFGWFGLERNEISSYPFNYTGFGMAMLSLILFLFISPEDQNENKNLKSSLKVEDTINNNSGSYTILSQQEEALIDPLNEVQREGPESNKKQDENNVFCPGLSKTTQQIIGFGLSLTAGCFFGFSFDPSQYVHDQLNQQAEKQTGNSGNYVDNLDFIHSHFLSIFLTSSMYFLAYCIYKVYLSKLITGKQESIELYIESILPAILSGVMWAGAMISWFVANETLSLSVAFPLCTTTPNLVGALWGVFYFKEIQGKKNFILLGAAFCCTLCAGVFVSISRA